MMNRVKVSVVVGTTVVLSGIADGLVASIIVTPALPPVRGGIWLAAKVSALDPARVVALVEAW